MLRTYLKDIIGFGDNALGTARANAVIDQGMDDLEEISTFDEDDIKRLCYTVREPGGMIPNPANPGQLCLTQARVSLRFPNQG